MLFVNSVGSLQSCWRLCCQHVRPVTSSHLNSAVGSSTGSSWDEKRLNRESLNEGRFQKQLGPEAHGERSGDEDQRRATGDIKRLGRQRQWQEALAVFSNFNNPDAALSTAVMDVCAKAWQLEVAKLIFEQMPVKTNRAYNVLIASFGRARQVADAEGLVDAMQQQSLAPNIVTFTSLMDGYGMLRDADSVWEVRGRMRALGIRDTSVSYGAAMAACAKAGHSDRVKELLSEMTANSLKPDLRNLTCVVLSHTSNGDEDGARRAFEELRSSGLQPDVVAFTALISCFSGEESLSKSETVWAEMLAAGVRPDSFAYNVFLQAALESQAHERFQEILAEMDAQGVQRSSETHKTVARASRLAFKRLQEEQESEQTAGLLQLPNGWHETLDPGTGRVYYWSAADPSSTTTWVRPTVP